MKKRKVIKRKRPVFTVVKAIVSPFVKKPKLYYLADKPTDSSILLANHVRKKGPLTYEYVLPVFTAKWGAGAMLGNYKSRWHYLRDIFYMQKLGFTKRKASMKATFEAVFSPMLYKGLSIIGTHQDARLKGTIDLSVHALKNDTSVLIFPENSNNGYLEVLTELHPGFTLLADRYRKETGKDAPMYPLYFHEEKNIILVGEPCYISEFNDKGMSRAEIAEEIRVRINALHDKIEAGELPEYVK